MTMRGYLSEYSLPELLRLLEMDSRTGQLKLQHKKNVPQAECRCYYIWFRQGRIVTAFNNLGARNLLQLMCQRQLFDVETANSLLHRSPVEWPFGLYLKKKKVLTAQQLQLLFSVQVIRQIRSLFTLEDAWFQFRDDTELPYSEMTGISVPATETILPGLRALKNWTGLQRCLPDGMSGLSHCVSQLTMRLKSNEQQIWDLANGEKSIQAISKKLTWPVSEVQQVAFCLITAGLVEETPIAILTPMTEAVFEPNFGVETSEAQSAANVSQAFISTLEQYLSSHS